MVYGSYNPNARYRQRSQRRAFSLVFTVFFFTLIFGAGFWIGMVRSDQSAYILNSDKQTLERQYQELQNEITQVRAEAQTANVRLEQLKASYNEILSNGPLQDLVTLLKKQLEGGVDPKRIEAVILSARPPKNCSEPKSRRLLIVTPNYKGPESRISMEAGLIAVWGEGTAAKTEGDGTEAWFDSSKPVKILFHPKGGAVTHKEGVLPLYHSLVIGEREFRFTVAADAKSFVKITYDSCDYP